MENFKQIKTYEDALSILGKKDFSRENLYPREIARRKLEIIIEALNEGWKPDWKNNLQLKWYPIFNCSNIDVSYGYSDYSFSYFDVYMSSHLYCGGEEIADYVGQQFLDLYKEMFLG